jgi:hypothetical protein
MRGGATDEAEIDQHRENDDHQMQAATEPRLLMAHAYASVVRGMNRNPMKGHNIDWNARPM